MTREEILIKSIWTTGKMKVHSNFFEKDVNVDLLVSDFNLEETHEIISEKFVQGVNDFLNLSVDFKPLMKRLLYKHCIECCENTSYGFKVLKGETEAQANLRQFGIKDEQTAFEKSHLRSVIIAETELEVNRYVRILFYPDWDNDHGCELIVKNGILLDHYGSNGIYLGQFDDEP